MARPICSSSTTRSFAFMKNGYVRADGRVIHDMYLMQVKSPDKSTEPWDYYNVVQTFKGEEAWTTKAESKCKLWK